MDDYIPREAAKMAVVEAIGKGHSPFNAIVMLPAADVVPVVRCIDCKHWHRSLSDDGKIEFFNFSYCEKGLHGFPNFFCANGERKGDDGE